jgi:hypothetical protein
MLGGTDPLLGMVSEEIRICPTHGFGSPPPALHSAVKLPLTTLWLGRTLCKSNLANILGRFEFVFHSVLPGWSEGHAGWS